MKTPSKTVFAIICSSTPEWRNIKLFSSLENAQKVLSELAEERKHKLGVSCFKTELNKFSFLLGWEEHKITYSIVELSID